MSFVAQSPDSMQRWAFMTTFKALNLCLWTLFEADERVGERGLYTIHIECTVQHHVCTQLYRIIFRQGFRNNILRFKCRNEWPPLTPCNYSIVQSVDSPYLPLNGERGKNSVMHVPYVWYNSYWAQDKEKERVRKYCYLRQKSFLLSSVIESGAFPLRSFPG